MVRYTVMTMDVRSRPLAGTALLLAVLLPVAVALPAAAHGGLASGASHDDPTVGELLLTPIVVGIIHLLAMVALFALAYRARRHGSVPDPASGKVPGGAKELFDPYMRDEDELTHAFRPNKRMYIVSRNLPHFFVLTGLAAFFSIYTYKWLGTNTVYIYTTIHATAIVLLFAHSAVTWRRTWYGVSPRALYKSFGSLSTLALRMPLVDLDGIRVKESRLKGMLDVSSLQLTFAKDTSRVSMTMRAIDAPDRIKEVISGVASRLKAGAG